MNYKTVSGCLLPGVMDKFGVHVRWGGAGAAGPLRCFPLASLSYSWARAAPVSPAARPSFIIEAAALSKATAKVFGPSH